MKDKPNDSYQEIIDAASHILYSKEVQKSVEEETRHFQRTVRQHSPGTHIVDIELKNIIQQANDELIPALVKIQPRLKPILPPYGLHLIRSWIGTYLRHSACGTTSPTTLAKRYARAFVRDAVNEYMEFREITPILGFSADREFYFSRKVLEDKIKFRFVKHDFRRHAQSLGFHFFPDPSDLKDDLVSGLPYEWVLLVSKPIPRKKMFLGDESLQFGRWTHQMLTALSLFKDQEFRTVNSYRSLNSFYFAGTKFMSRGNYPPLPHGDKYHLSEIDIKSFGAFWRKLEKFIPFEETLPPRIAMAIRYFESSSSKPLHERFLDLSISLEALFAISSENTYRLPIRVSSFLHGHGDDAPKTFEDVHKIWDMRNAIAHGNLNVRDSKKYQTLSAWTPKLRQIVRKSINKHLELFSFLKNDKVRYKKLMGKDFEKKYVIGKGWLSQRELSQYK